MNFTKKTWSKYISALRRVNDKATESLLYYVQEIGGIPSNYEEMQELIYVAFGISQKYGEASAAIAAEMYDAMAMATGAAVDPAVPAEPATMDEVAKSIVGAAKTNNVEVVAGAVGRLVKLCGVDTTMQNALRDGAEWAWIPTGETCAFCIALASNGWQPASRAAIKNGHAEHVHANCDCTYAIRFDGKSEVEGYNDGAAFKQMYYGADLDHWNTPDGKPPAGVDLSKQSLPEKRINAMRRQFYSQNKASGDVPLNSSEAEEVSAE